MGNLMQRASALTAAALSPDAFVAYHRHRPQGAGRDSGCRRSFSALCLVTVLGSGCSVGSEARCDIPVLDAARLTADDVADLETPALIKGAYTVNEDNYSKAALKERYGTGEIEIRDDDNVRDRFEIPHRRGEMVPLQSWIDSLDTGANQQFVFVYHNELVGRMFDEGYLFVPESVRRVSLHRIFTAGTENEFAAPFHSHEAGWLGLLTGEKTWLLGSPANKSMLTQYVDTSLPYRVLSRVPGILECRQRSGDIMYVPDSWFHSTYNTGEWTASMAGEGIVEGIWHADASLGNVDAVRDVSFLDLFGDRDSTGRTPLHMAAWSGYSAEFIEVLLDKGFDINIRDLDMMSPLHYSINNFRHIMELLLKRGAAPHGVDEHRRQPMHYAHTVTDMSVLEVLRDYGGDPFWPDVRGDRPIHLMARAGNHLVVEWLMAQGENPDVANHAGATPIQVATHFGHAAVVKSLMRGGAVAWDRIAMAMHAAKELGHVEVAKTIYEHVSNGEAAQS